MLNFRGTTVLVTGSSMGIGKGLTRCFARDGANLVLTDHPSREADLKAWADELGRRYAVRTWVFAVDLTDPDGAERLHRDVVAAAGDVYGLVNNAGICWWGRFDEMPPVERLEKMVLLNCMAYAKLCRLVLPSMIGRKGGAILNVSSIAAFQPVANMALYGASKAFVQSLTESIRYELPRGSGVTVSTLNPAFTKTALLSDACIPADFIPLSISFSSADDIARQGYRAFRKGKMFHVTGWQNKILHQFTPRLLPRRAVNRISWLACHRWSDFFARGKSAVAENVETVGKFSKHE